MKCSPQKKTRNVRRGGVLIYLIMLLLNTTAQTVPPTKANPNTKPFPYNNPVITHMYTADASPHVIIDGRVWMVTSVDHEDGGGYSTMHKYHTFSSADMVNWTDHGEVFNIEAALNGKPEPEGEDWALWAPDMVYYKGKYYLYYPVRILYTDHGYDEKKRKTKSYIAVAVSNAPNTPFTVINDKIEGTKGIDPSVFIDDDGQPYLYFGHHWGAKLKDNMIELDGEPVKMDVDDPNFMEAIWMNKRNGKYYISYHSKYNKPIDPDNPNDPKRMKSTLDWVVGDSPLGPFRYGGVMNNELGVNVSEGPKAEGYDYVPWRLYQSNHGGIVEYHGQEYLFYHTSALSSWRQDEFKGPGTWTQRSVCIDYLNYDKDDNVLPVQQTLKGVKKVKVKQPYSIALDPEKAEMSGDNETQASIFKYSDVDLGTGYYYFRISVEIVEVDTRVEIRKGSKDGQLLGTILLDENSKVVNNGLAETLLRDAKGKTDIYLVVYANGNNVAFSKPEFIAGAPLKLK